MRKGRRNFRSLIYKRDNGGETPTKIFKYFKNSLNYGNGNPGETSVNFSCVESSKSIKPVFIGGCDMSMNGDGCKYS